MGITPNAPSSRPGREAEVDTPTAPTLPRMIRRAVLLRCPWCGHRRTFLRGWFRRHDRCRTCGIRWRREEGTELGALALNTVVTFAVLAVAMTIGFIATSPDIPVLPFVLGLSSVAILLPVLIYPFTYTVWLAIDLRVHPAERDEILAARTATAAGVPGADVDSGT